MRSQDNEILDSLLPPKATKNFFAGMCAHQHTRKPSFEKLEVVAWPGNGPAWGSKESLSSPSGLPSSLLRGEQIRGCHLVSSASARHSGWEMARNPQPHDPRAPDARAGPALPLELGPQTQTHGPCHVALKVTQTRPVSVDSDRAGEGWQVGRLPLH